MAAVYLVPSPARLLSVGEGEVDHGDPKDGRQRVALWSAALQRELGCRVSQGICRADGTFVIPN